MFLRSCHKIKIASVVLVMLLQLTNILAQDSTHECTHAVILGPLAPGLKYIDGSNSILAYHKNKSTTWKMKLYQKGTPSAKGDYIYQYTFIGIGMAWNGTYFRGLSAMNEKGNAINFADAYNPIGSDDYYVREKAAGLADNFEELCDLVSPESLPNLVAVSGFDQHGNIKNGYLSQNNLTSVTPENPILMEGKAAVSEGKATLSNVDYWFHGDPNKLEVRDVAYCWHRFNLSSDFAIINVPKYNIMWCTAAKTSDSPFIPFDLNDPYVYSKFQDGTYYNSANYSQQEIDEIEDIIMAIDGAVIGDLRDIQMRIAEGLPIITPNVSISSTSLSDGVVGEVYNSSLQAIGGTPPYHWSLISGTLPVGINMAADGVMSGTPTQAGEQKFTAQVKDSKTSAANKEFSITIVPESAILASAHFDHNEDNFSYIDNAFRNSNESNYSDGTWTSSGGYTGGAVQVKLGGIDENDILDMSGGWQRKFSLVAPTEIIFSFRYNLTQSSDYEADELSQVLVSVDNNLYGESPNDYVAQIFGNGDGGNPGTTGWQLFEGSTGILSAEEHTLVIGGYNNKKTTQSESTEILIDDVLVLKKTNDPSAVNEDNDQNNPIHSNDKPESFFLFQNYPNPFNSSTTIIFDLPFHAKVTLAIFDLSGNKIASILDSALSAGFYRTVWNSENQVGTSLPSGVYFYKIYVEEDLYSNDQQRSFTVTRKMLLIK